MGLRFFSSLILESKCQLSALVIKGLRLLGIKSQSSACLCKNCSLLVNVGAYSHLNRTGSVSNNKNAAVGLFLQDVCLTLFKICLEINVVFNVALLLWNC